MPQPEEMLQSDPRPADAISQAPRTIPLVRKIGGNNRYRESLRFITVAHAIVDHEDYERFSRFRWIASCCKGVRSYYAVRKEKINGKTVNILLAREILGLSRNPGYGGPLANHINHDTLDNRRSNLRVATKSQEQANRRRNRNATFPRGVRKHGQRWGSQIQCNYTYVYLGNHTTCHEAAHAYNHAAQLLHGSVAELSDIPPESLPDHPTKGQIESKVEKILRDKGLLPQSPPLVHSSPLSGA